MADGSDLHHKRLRLKAALCLAAVLVLAGGIAACGSQQAAQAPASPLPVPVLPAPEPLPGLDRTPEEARRAAAAEERRDVIRMQQRLRAREAAWRAERAKVPGVGGVRCINGQRMKRLPNGWKEDGTC